MNNIKAIHLLFSLVLILGCTSDFDEINTNPRTLTVGILDENTYRFFFRRGLYETTDLIRGPKFQLLHSLFGDVYSNYFATTAANFESDRFVLVGAWIDRGYNSSYADVLPQVKAMEDLSEEYGLEVENAMSKVWRVYSFHRLTDYWGPIPYLNFGNGELSVPFDSQETIYKDFFSTLDEAVAVFKANAGTTSTVLDDVNDVMYGGDVDKWYTFANTLRLRLAIRVKYVDPDLARTEAEKAVADGVMESNDQSAFVTTTPTWANPYNRISQWGEFRMSADMESFLKGYRDPRVERYFQEAAIPDATDDPIGFSFNYEGMRNGQTKSDKQGTDFNSLASNMGPEFNLRGDRGPNWAVLKATEAYFLRAEGALEGWNMGGTSESLYEAGISASLSEWGTDGNDLEGNDYISSTNVPAAIDASTPPVSTVPVAYNVGGTKEEQLEQIITQKWLAIFPDGKESWAERRRTGYPTLYDRLGSDNINIPASSIPRRLPYGTGSYETNTKAVNEAVATFLEGKDNGTVKLWWDAK